MAFDTVYQYLLRMTGYWIIWTLVMYLMHRAAHDIPALWYFHRWHHMVTYQGEWEFSWWNLVFWFNDWYSTVDQWIMEIIPTALFIYIFPETWPFGVYYYLDGVCLSEGITDHNPRICMPILSMGRYHLRHHANLGVNYDQFTHLWDWVFGTQADPIPKGCFIKKGNSNNVYTGIIEKDTSM